MNIQEQGYPSLQSAFVVVKVPCLYFPSLAVMLQGKLVFSLCIISTQKIVCWLFLPSTLRYILPIDLFPVAASSWYTVCCGASLGTPRKKARCEKDELPILQVMVLCIHRSAGCTEELLVSFVSHR